MVLTDKDIVRELNSGNREIFDTIFNKFYSLLCFEARGYIKSENLVEEIVCDVFTRIWLNRKTLDIRISLRDYLVKAVHNKCIDYYRQIKKQRNISIYSDSKEHVISTLMDLGENPLEYILTKELEERINVLIDSLPPQYQKAFKLSRFHDKTYEEIASEMHISVNSVKTNIKNALLFLRNELKGFFILLILFWVK